MFQTQKLNTQTLSKWIIIPIALLATAAAAYKSTGTTLSSALSQNNIESRKVISKAISAQINQNTFPQEISIEKTLTAKTPRYKINYTLEADLQEHAENLLKKYKPDYAAIVMMDAQTGEVLAMSSFEKGNSDGNNLALKATYPAASIFKVITASTAVDKAGVSPQHRIAFNGGNYTLYKKNVLSNKITRWTRFITLKDAFARSINTAFGRLTLESINPEDLAEYANKFSFNKKIQSDFSVESSTAKVPTERGFALTEVASGYNRFNTLSPVHGAMIASTIINNGKMPTPYLVKSIQNEKNEVIYTGETLNQGQIISAASAEKVKEMMEQTVLSGTSRKTFKHLVRDKKFKEVEMGGKTGHFSGTNPKGRTDWFVGYASDEDHRIAVAAITVNVKKWTVKSSALGEMMFRKYFKNKIEERETILSDNTAPEIRTERKVKTKKRRTS